MKKAFIVFAAVFSTLLILGSTALLLYINSPTRKFASDFDAGRTENLSSLYHAKIQGHPLREKRLQRMMEGKAQKAAYQYLSGQTEYDLTLKKLRLLQELHLDLSDTEMEKCIGEVERAHEGDTDGQETAADVSREESREENLSDDEPSDTSEEQIQDTSEEQIQDASEDETAKAPDNTDPSVIELDISSSGLTELPDLSKYPNLETLNAVSNSISDFSAVSESRKLKTLWIAGNPFDSLEFLRGMDSIENLGIGESSLSDISVVTSLPNLRILDFWYTNVSDISMLSGMNGLEEVYMSYSNVTTLQPIMNLPNLRVISIRGLDIPESEISEFVRKHPNCRIYRD